jgi:hypothetical protein
MRRRDFITLLGGAAVAIACTSSLACAQTSRGLIKSDPRAAYDYFEKIISARPNLIYRKGDAQVSLLPCEDAQAYIGFEYPDSEVTFKLAELALEATHIAGELRQAGYPPAVWEPHLARYVSDSLANIKMFRSAPRLDDKGSQFTRRLTSILVSFRDQHPAASLPEPNAGAGVCGGGEEPVRLIAIPKSGRIQYINMIFYNLCRLQGLNQDDAGSCDHWTDYSEGKSEGANMSGRYKVRVSWPDGTVTSRNLNVDDLLGDTATFVIRK